jgi:hypothetical protein
MKFLLVASLLTSALAASVTIKNDLPSTIYLKWDWQAHTGNPEPIKPNGSVVKPIEGLTNALKLSYKKDAGEGIQFDYSVDTTNTMYYDISDIPGHPFDLEATAHGAPTVGCDGVCRTTKATEANKDFTVRAYNRD